MPLRTVRSAMTTMNGAAVADVPQGRRKSARLWPVTCATAQFLVASCSPHGAHCECIDVRSLCCAWPIIVVQRPQSQRFNGGLMACAVVAAKCCPCLAATAACCSSRCSNVASTFAIEAARGLQTSLRWVRCSTRAAQGGCQK